MKEKPTPEGPLELHREGDSEADEDEEDVDTGSINEAMEDTNNNVEQQENNLADEDDAAAAADLNAAAVELSSPVDGDGIEENVHVAEADAEAEDGNAKLPAATENEKLHDESLENVSDISASSSNEEDMADGWMAPATGSPTLGDDEGMGMDFGVTDPSSSSNMPRNRSFTICSVITNTSEHGSTRSQRRENVDRLLMSGSGPMSVGSMGRRPSRCSLGGSSLAGSDMSPMQQPRGLERPNVAYTYDPNYYKSPGDWLRFVPRRSSNDVRSSQASSSGDPPSITDSNLSPHHMNNHVYGHGGSPGYGIATGGGHPVNPDLYYRGFDNTRVRFGTNYRYPGVSANNAPTSRVRGDLGHHRHHHHQSAGVARFQDGAAANNMLGPNGEVFDTPSMGDANINLNQTMGPPAVGDSLGRGYVQQYSAPGMYPNMISVPIDEEEGGTLLETSEHNLSRKEATSPPLEIHCAPNEEAEVFDENILNHHLEDDSALKHHAMNPQLVGDVQDVERQHGGAVIPSAVPNQDQPSHPATLSRTNCSPPPPSFEAGMRFDSSLRIGGIIPPSRSNSNRGTNTTHSHPLPPHLLEQKMHEASWDSKYETYACRVDQRQEDRSVEIPIFSMTRPHMRSFHCAWLAFFFAFLAWFAITPLLGEVQKSLGLSKEQIWTTNICSVAGAVVTRCVAGLFCDIYGARWMSAAVLFICGIPTIFTGAVNTVEGLSILRLVTGIGGSAFVTCQYWTSTMFTKEVAGTANALAAGWGNLGGGVAQIFVGSMLFPLFKLIYNAAGTERDPAELSWRTCCVIPGLMCTAFTFVVIRYSDDSPKGNYTKRKHLGLMQKQSAMTHIKAAIHDHNTWLLLIQYGCCFGVELTTSNAAALYFKEEFELSTEAAAAVASTFGWMNLFARGLGGFLSDISNAYRGMRGRLTWQLLCFLLEGVFVMVFSKANTLGGAITALMTFSLFVQGAEGSTFGIVPYLNPNVTGTVAGIVGAGGNAGAVIFSIMFRQMDYRDAFFWMGASTSIVSVLSSFVWIKGYEGLFFQRRVTPTPAPQQQQLEKVDENNSKPPNTSSELQAGVEEGAQNHSRSYIETDPPSSISGPLSH